MKLPIYQHLHPHLQYISVSATVDHTNSGNNGNSGNSINESEIHDLPMLTDTYNDNADADVDEADDDDDDDDDNISQDSKIKPISFVCDFG